MKPGDKIRAFRKEHKYTLRQFAEICGLSFAQVRFMENGTNSSGKPSKPLWDSLAKAAAGMGITVYELVEGCDDYELGYMKSLEHKIPQDRLAVIDNIILANDEQFSLIKSYVDFVMK